VYSYIELSYEMKYWRFPFTYRYCMLVCLPFPWQRAVIGWSWEWLSSEATYILTLYLCRW